MTTKANIVEITRFEALALYFDYKEKIQQAKDSEYWSLIEGYEERAQKWLEIACDIEKADSDKLNESLVG